MKEAFDRYVTLTDARNIIGTGQFPVMWRRPLTYPAGGRIPIKNGCVRIPEKPGLGVELDRDQLARGRERYAKLPYRKRDDEAEMRRHVDPNWKRVLPRW